MFPKNSKENQELKKEIKYNESVDKQMKMGFDAAFIKGSAANTGFVELVTPQNSSPSNPWLNPRYKNWVLFAFAGIAFLVLLVLILTEVQHNRGQDRELQSFGQLPYIQTAGFHSSNQLYNTSDSKIEALVQESTTTTTTTTTTTEAPTTQKQLHYLKASIIVNNATVPQMDRTLLHQFSRADAFVVLYVIEGNSKNIRRVGKSPVDKNTLSPKWNYLFEHEMTLWPGSFLNFELWDSDNFNNDELIGKMYVSVDQLLNEGLNGKIIKKNYGKGYLWFTVHWKEMYKYI